MQVYNSHYSRNNHYPTLSLDAVTMVQWPWCSGQGAMAMVVATVQ